MLNCPERCVYISIDFLTIEIYVTDCKIYLITFALDENVKCLYWCHWSRSLIYWSETSFHGAITWYQKQQVKMFGILICATWQRMNLTCLWRYILHDMGLIYNCFDTIVHSDCVICFSGWPLSRSMRHWAELKPSKFSFENQPPCQTLTM